MISKGKRGKGKNGGGVPLSFDTLGGWIAEGISCHLVNKSVWENDNLSEYGNKSNLVDDKDYKKANNMKDENGSEGDNNC